MKYLSTSFALLVLIPSIASAVISNKPIAEVLKIRGVITQLSPGAKIARQVELGDKFVEDTSIVTGSKSFIKIKFIDNSELNVGPESKIVITEMKTDSVGIISLLKGRIRTEVQKSAMEPNSNKFFVKTRTAAIGVRGTEFQTIYNPDNKMTSLLTYKGEVAMAKVDEKLHEKLEEKSTKEVVRDEVTKEVVVVETPAKPIDEVAELNKVLQNKSAVLVPSGQNSFASDSLKKTSLPVKISPVQLEALYKNEDFNEKSSKNLNLQASNAAPVLKVAAQTAPAEGLYNEKTGDFAPKAGGYIDLNTGLYVAPTDDSKLDADSGVYVPNKIGNIDADTGQYVAPKGLVLDANKGFVVADTGESKADNKTELLALKDDLNKSISKDIIIDEPVAEEVEVPFNINEKFKNNRFAISLWGMDQTLTANKNSNDMRYFEMHSRRSNRFSLEWQMASSERFSPMIGFDYTNVDFDENRWQIASRDSKKLLGLSIGFQYAASKNLNLFAKFGVHQDHFLDQTSVGSFSNTYNLKKVALSRITTGFNAEFWRGRKFSLETNVGIMFTFRKRLNGLVVYPGDGPTFEILPKYALSEKKWLGIGLKVENQFQRTDSTVSYNRMGRESGGLELKYIAEF